MSALRWSPPNRKPPWICCLLREPLKWVHLSSAGFKRWPSAPTARTPFQGWTSSRHCPMGQFLTTLPTTSHRSWSALKFQNPFHTQTQCPPMCTWCSGSMMSVFFHPGFSQKCGRSPVLSGTARGKWVHTVAVECPNMTKYSICTLT